MNAQRFSLLAIVAALLGCSEPTATLSGDAFAFNGGVDGRIAGAEISVLEDPTITTTTDDVGHFVLEGIPVGSDATLLLSHPDYVPIQTGTIELEAGGAERVTFQAVTPTIRGLLAELLMVEIDPEACQMVTTVTRVGRSLYEPNDHGEEGATVTIDPPLPAASGPIYFDPSVLPDRRLTETSNDGGVLFVNVPPGEYTWTAHKDGVAFTQVRMKCRAGLLVNASPPWGLQALAD